MPKAKKPVKSANKKKQKAAPKPKPTAQVGAAAAETLSKPFPKLPSAWWIMRQSITLLWRNKRLFLGIVIIYGLLNLVLVKGFSATTDVGNLKTQLHQAFNGHFGSLISNVAVFAVLISSSGSGSGQAAGSYQLFLTLIASLAIVWTLRLVLAGKSNLRIRDAYYRGMYPLIPVILVLLVITLQLIPMIIGTAIYSAVLSNGIAVGFWEHSIWLIGFLATLALSLYFVTSSIFGLYIVTLPDMTPLTALRSARKLVRKRRWLVFGKLIFLPVALLLVASIIMLPVIAVIGLAAPWVFFILSIMMLAIIHSYLYHLYRELIRE